MNILILDRHKEDPMESRMIRYVTKELRKIGHSVTSAVSLRNVAKKLDTYDVALVHPRLEEYHILREEIEKRESFDAILFSTEPLDFECDERKLKPVNLHFYDLNKKYFIRPDSDAQENIEIYRNNKLKKIIEIFQSGLRNR